MSDISDRADVQALLCDYVAVDGGGKLNMIGGGISLVLAGGPGGGTAPFGLAVIIDFDIRDVGEAPAVEVVLEDDAGRVVQLPGLAGPLGQPQTMVIAQTPQIEVPSFPGLGVPRRAVRPRVQIAINFYTGLPLAPGTSYRWRIRIDHVTQDHWMTGFHVPLPPSGPVLGGAGGPASIPNLPGS